MQFQETTIQNSLKLVEQWHTYANTIQIDSHKVLQLKMYKLSQYPKDKKLLFELLNTIFTSNDNKKLASFIDDLIQTYTLGEYFTPSQKAFFWLFKHSTKHTPDFSVPLIIDYIKQECASFLTNSAFLDEYLDTKSVQEIPVHTTLLLQDALNEHEANKNVEKYIQLLAKENIESLSINLLAIHPKINFICQNSCMQSLENKLSMLFRKAIKYKKINKTKKLCLKIPNERFGTLILDAFEQVVAKKEFETLDIVIGFCIDNMQILPFLERLNNFMLKNEKQVLNSIEIKLIKTRNNKKVIRHFYEVIQYLFLDSKSTSLKLWLNSHNLFDMALAYEVAREQNRLKDLNFQMDKGFFLAYRGAISTLTKNVWVHSCVLDFDDFFLSMNYLLNRFNQYSKRNNQFDMQQQSFLKYTQLDIGTNSKTTLPSQKNIHEQTPSNRCLKELLFISKLCHKVKLVERLIQKIAWCASCDAFLSFELFIEEDDMFVEDLKTTLAKSIEDFFACYFGVGNFNSAKLSMGHKTWCIMISSSSFEVVLKLNASHNLMQSIKVCQSIKEPFESLIYTLNKKEYKQLSLASKQLSFK
jgi:hypothetical protein